MEKYNKLYKYSQRKVSFHGLSNSFFSVILPSLVVIFNALLFYFLSSSGLEKIFYGVAIFDVALVTRYSRFRPAVITGLLSGLLVILISDTERNQTLLFEVGVFIMASFLISYLIDADRRAVEIDKLKKQEKLFSVKFIELHRDLKKASDEIKARDEFLSITSHELRTPLTTMLLKLHNMLNTVKNVSLANFSVESLMRVLENAETQIKVLTTMINDLLNVSMITTGRMNLFKEQADLADITRQVLENFSEMLEKEGYKVKLENKGPVVGYWDKGRVEQAVTNLVSNAIKYGRGQPIDIKVFNHGGFGKFVIRDRGIGISKTEYKFLFHLFRRIESREVEKKKGLGVGLYITNQIVQSHGGKIKVSSIPKVGSTFTMELPVEEK